MAEKIAELEDQLDASLDAFDALLYVRSAAVARNTFTRKANK